MKIMELYFKNLPSKPLRTAASQSFFELRINVFAARDHGRIMHNPLVVLTSWGTEIASAGGV